MRKKPIRPPHTTCIFNSRRQKGYLLGLLRCSRKEVEPNDFYTHQEFFKYKGYKHTKTRKPVSKGLPGGSDGKRLAYNVGDPGLIPGWGDPWRNGNPLQYSS